MENSYRFFQNKDCEYFPCHKVTDSSDFSCLFCYCPLYALGDRCGGCFQYLGNGIKDCSACVRPHMRENYDEILAQMADIMEIVKRL